MSVRFLTTTMMILATSAIFSGCVDDRRVSDRPRLVVVDRDRDDRQESRRERYARGDYRRGFQRDAERNGEFCRLRPADTDCIGRRF